MKPIEYRNHLLSSSSKQTIDGMWTTEAVVTVRFPKIMDIPISLPNLYPTKEEADKHSIELGKHYVDNELL